MWITLLFFLNQNEQNLILNFSQIPHLSCAADAAAAAGGADGADGGGGADGDDGERETMLKKCHVRDVWLHQDLGFFDGEWNGTVASHDSKFFILS